MSSDQLKGLYAAIAAPLVVLITPLLALAYFAIPDGKEELTYSTVSAWADPARDVAGSLLTFGSPIRVYSTYLQLLALLLPAVFLCSTVLYKRRKSEAHGGELWGWRIARFGYGVCALALLVIAALLIPNSHGANGPGAVNAVFLAAMLPGMLASTIGSTTLGVALIRRRYESRAASWLLALTLPWFLFSNIVLGHNGMGLVLVFAAWGLVGFRLHRGEPAAVDSAVISQPA